LPTSYSKKGVTAFLSFFAFFAVFSAVGSARQPRYL
jgi:hypothetical protein